MLDDLICPHGAESLAAAHAGLFTVMPHATRAARIATATVMPHASRATRIASSFFAERHGDDMSFVSNRGADQRSFFVDQSSADALKQGQKAAFQAAEATNLARGALKDSSRAARQALSAAKVAAFTQMVCLLGSIGGLLNAYVGYKMDDDELPAPVRNALHMREE